MGIYLHLKEWDSWADAAEWNDAVEWAGDLCGPLWHSAFAAHYQGPDATAAVLIAAGGLWLPCSPQPSGVLLKFLDTRGRCSGQTMSKLAGKLCRSLRTWPM
ncbi:hypothetical protein ACIBQ1_60420 [Nonomuraea sp. NPDC050153]|uniref:hypothetical protein n=1 Tax=Nonomuraea sp. NPDC050153 TaxID=3364359 RepID=UPI0037B0F65C